MLTLPGWLVILLEQGFIVLTLLAIVLYLRTRRLRKLLSSAREAAGQRAMAQAVRTLSSPELKDFGLLQEKLALSQQRVKNLERFRDMFFDLKDRVGDLMLSQHQMHGHMEAEGLPLEKQKTLLAAFDKLRREKAQLEEHLRQLDAELELLLDDTQRHKLDQVIRSDATEVIQSQQAEIGRLIQEIADLTLESASAKRIQSTIDQLNLKTGDLIVAIEILQDENEYLNEQNLLLQNKPGNSGGKADTEIEALHKQLADKQAEYEELYEKHLRLESEYLKIR